MKKIAALVACLSLGACTTAQVTTAAQDNEKVDTAALALYAATAGVLNGLEALPNVTPAQTASYEAIRSKAWLDLSVVNAAYNAGQVISLAALQADNAAATAAKGN
jgi:hypothetical protein